jgi:tetratricopeptide (TPR) repeat protein
MTSKKMPQSIKTILLISSLFVLCLLVSLISYAVYCGMAQKGFNEGKAAYEAKDWQTAAQRFERVASFYKLSLPSHSAEVKTLSDECSLLIQGGDKRTQGDYAAAIEIYNNYTELYPEPAKQFQVATTVSAVYADWVSALRQSGQYDAALEKSLELQKAYPDSPSAVSVGESLPALYMDWAANLRKDGNFEESIAKYRIILKEYGQISSAEQTKTAIAETYREWGDSLAVAGEYDLAVEKYNVLLNEFSSQAAVEGAENVLAEIYIQWADQLRGNNRPDQAFDKYQKIVNELRNTPSASKANAALAPTLLEWALVAQKGQDYSKEIELLRTLTSDYSRTPEADKAGKMLLTAYDFLGQQQMAKNSFLLAMKTYITAKEFALDEAAQSSVDAGYGAALQGLANDTGTDGQSVIAAALQTACAGQKAESPSVGLSADQPAKGVVCASSILLPSELTATTPGNFRYAVEVTYKTVKIQSCPYGNWDYWLERDRQMATVVLRNSKTGAVAKTTQIYGSAPIACPYRYTFYSNYVTETGGPVDSQDIIDWLIKILK